MERVAAGRMMTTAAVKEHAEPMDFALATVAAREQMQQCPVVNYKTKKFHFKIKYISLSFLTTINLLNYKSN